MKKPDSIFIIIFFVALPLVWVIVIGLLSVIFSFISDDSVSFNSVSDKFLFLNIFFIGIVVYLVYLGLSLLGFVAVFSLGLGLIGYAYKQTKRFRDGNISELFFTDVEGLQKSLNKYQFLILILGFITIIGVLMLISKENVYQPILATIGGIVGGLAHFKEK